MELFTRRIESQVLVADDTRKAQFQVRFKCKSDVNVKEHLTIEDVDSVDTLGVPIEDALEDKCEQWNDQQEHHEEEHDLQVTNRSR